MTLTLAAFAKTQGAAAAAEVEEENGYTSDHSDAAPVGKPASKPLTLVDIAREMQQPKQQPSLEDVARTYDRQQQQDQVGQQLSAIAKQVNAEEEAASQRRKDEIDRALAATSKQVQQEQATKRHAIVQQAAKEEAAYNQQDDAFEEEEEEDPVADRAAELLVASTSKETQLKTLSVDRHVLKQRQQSHGLQSKSTGKARTMKDTLSSFQFQQLSLTQQRVFRAMLVDDAPQSRRKKKQPNRHAIDELAKDRATQQQQRQKLFKLQPSVYAKLDDERHCRFQPRTRSASGGGGGGGRRGRGDDDEDDDDNNGDNQRTEDFVRRMEATERVRVEQLRRTRAEREYNARVDKKECPQCGNPQSYAELTQKRKKCPNCGVTYKSRLAWSDIADAFLARMAAHVAGDPQPAELSHKAHSNQSSKPPRTWAAVRDEFLGRVQLDLHQRELSKALILQELEAQCSFAPEISERARRLRLGDFDERLRRDLEARRLRQEQYRLLSAAVATHERAASSKKTHALLLPRAFERRLQLDLAQRREREARYQPPRPLPAGRKLY